MKTQKRQKPIVKIVGFAANNPEFCGCSARITYLGGSGRPPLIIKSMHTVEIVKELSEQLIREKHSWVSVTMKHGKV